MGRDFLVSPYPPRSQRLRKVVSWSSSPHEPRKLCRLRFSLENCAVSALVPKTTLSTWVSKIAPSPPRSRKSVIGNEWLRKSGHLKKKVAIIRSRHLRLGCQSITVHCDCESL